MTALKQLSIPLDLFGYLSADRELMRREREQRRLYWPEYYTGLLKCRIDFVALEKSNS